MKQLATESGELKVSTATLYAQALSALVAKSIEFHYSSVV